MAQRVLLIQLARLGDLVQTIPAITALKDAHEDWTIDLLCPAHLEPIGHMIPGIASVVPWDGAAWNRRALSAEREILPEHVAEADAALRTIAGEPYDRAVVLNQHPRAILAGALLARASTGTITGNPLDHTLSPWAAYVRAVAGDRGDNRIHLADVFCGMCGVSPPTNMGALSASAVSLPVDLDPIGQSGGAWIGVLVGAGEPERLVPVSVLVRVITGCLTMLNGGRVVLIGSEQEQERAHAIQTALPSPLLGRVWDTTGRLSLTELACVLTRCDVVVGADTGPLHLATALGTTVIGWYFGRARVHETGPYGQNHWVWQVEGGGATAERGIAPQSWPIESTVALVFNGQVMASPHWSLWASRQDRWGAYYDQAGQEPTAPLQREQIWRELHSTSARSGGGGGVFESES